MNWIMIEEKIKTLPDDSQKEACLFIDVLVHNCEIEKAATSELHQKEINQKKVEIMKMLIQEKDLDLLLDIHNLIHSSNSKLTPWEEEQLEIGLKDLEKGNKIPHKDVMKKIDRILK